MFSTYTMSSKIKGLKLMNGVLTGIHSRDLAFVIIAFKHAVLNHNASVQDYYCKGPLSAKRITCEPTGTWILDHKHIV